MECHTSRALTQSSDHPSLSNEHDWSENSGEEGDNELNAACPSHPLGVKPSGNALTTNQNLRCNMGHFGKLPDETVLLLLEWLDEQSLFRLGASCRGLFAYAAADQLWRDLFILNAKSDFSWRGSWRSTCLNLPSAKLPSVDCSNLFSDALHRPFFCSQISLAQYASSIPSANRIPRMADLRVPDFTASWTDKPFILTNPVKKWPVFEKWCQASLLEKFGETAFRAEAVDWPLRTYLEYLNNNSDESPLYLFDRDFVSKMELKVGGPPDGAYWPPDAFQEDLFSLLGDQRPDSRWVIIGPERSGSTFHKDPNATSAWNAVIRGSKYWIMFPSSVSIPTPPGVYVSVDQSEVTSPLSIAEWLLSYHEEARSTVGCKEGICGEGEVLHVPSGWWHLVVNLEPAIAITQNFVPRLHLASAIDFLKNKPDQVSGFKRDVTDPLGLFMQRLEKAYPELLETLQPTTNTKKRKWDDVVDAKAAENAEDTGGFSFGFGDDSYDIEDEE